MIDLEIEEWRDIAGYEGLYQVSNMGRVKSLNYRMTGKERVRKLQKSNKGYLEVFLYKDGKGKLWLVHRLVALAFPEICGEFFEGSEVNHIDENPENNMAFNLCFVTHKENINWGTCTQRISKSMKGKCCGEKNHMYGKHHTEEAKNSMSKPVNQYTMDETLIATYPSAMEAMRTTGIDHSAICKCCQGKRKTAGGFIWRYKKDGI